MVPEEGTSLAFLSFLDYGLASGSHWTSWFTQCLRCEKASSRYLWNVWERGVVFVFRELENELIIKATCRPKKNLRTFTKLSMHQEVAQGLRGMEARDLDSAPQFSSRLDIVSEAITRRPAMDPICLITERCTIWDWFRQLTMSLLASTVRGGAL